MNKPPEAPEHPDTLFSEIKGLTSPPASGLRWL